MRDGSESQPLAVFKYKTVRTPTAKVCLRKKLQHVALEPGLALQLVFVRILPGVHCFLLNLSFAGIMALELGPAPHVATCFCSFMGGGPVDFRLISCGFLVDFL